MATAQLMGARHKAHPGRYVDCQHLPPPFLLLRAGRGAHRRRHGGAIRSWTWRQPSPGEQGPRDRDGDAPSALRRYVTAVRSWLKGEGPATHLPQRPTVRPVPLYVAAITSRTVEVASELADGIMPFLWSAERAKKSKEWIDRGRAKASGLGKVDVTVGLPVFVGDDVKAMREAARANLGLVHDLPVLPETLPRERFRVRSRSDGEGGGGASLSDRILDAVCLTGPDGALQGTARGVSQRRRRPADPRRPDWRRRRPGRDHVRFAVSLKRFHHNGGRPR